MVATLSDEFFILSLNVLILAMNSALLSSNLGVVFVVDVPRGVDCDGFDGVFVRGCRDDCGLTTWEMYLS